MPKILLGVTGSVAAIYTRELYDDLRRAGHDVRIVATKAALYFFDPRAIAPVAAGQRNAAVVSLDDDEWSGPKYQRGDEVLHIELRRWADVLLIAPLDANTLAKLALGTCDNCLTCVYRAWDRDRRIVLAPAMNTLMWQHPATARHLTQIAIDVTGLAPPTSTDAMATCTWINANCPTLNIVAPVEKKLACDDVGLGAMAERSEILKNVAPTSLGAWPRGTTPPAET